MSLGLTTCLLEKPWLAVDPVQETREIIRMTLVPKHADDLGRQGMIQDLDDALALTDASRCTGPASMCLRARRRIS